MIFSKFGLIITGTILVIMIITSICAWIQLPPDAQISNHIIVSNRPAGKVEGLLIIPLFALLLTIMFLIVPRSIDVAGNLRNHQDLDDANFNWKVENWWLAQEYFSTFWVCAFLLLTFYQVPPVFVSLGFSSSTKLYWMAFFGLSLIMTGRYLFRMSNRYELGRRTHGSYTIRTRHTLSNEIIWREVHLRIGRYLIIFGFILVTVGVIFW
jgi:hypothetical protein